jgi:SET domain-containing protein
MMLVETYLDKSEIKSKRSPGIGLFAKKDIKKGTVVWKLNSIFDLSLKLKDWRKLDKITKDFMNFYMPDFHGLLLVLGDNSRFINHSCHPNIGSISDTEMMALRDIEKGTEITENYNEHWKGKRKPKWMQCEGDNSPEAIIKKNRSLVSEFLKDR